MGAIEILPSLKERDPFDEARFLKFLESRSEDERWQLIDGEPIQMMTPPTMRHQRIAANLERLLNVALEKHRPGLDALREVGLAIEDHPNFRPIADLAIIDFDVDPGSFEKKFYLAAEVLSDSNTRDYISTKRKLYADCPDCLYVLIVSQADFAIEIWSRADGWKGGVLRSPDDVIELPEFGFSCLLKELYRGTQVA